jgi:hypothetical protein
VGLKVFPSTACLCQKVTTTQKQISQEKNFKFLETLIYIRESINYERMSQFEKEDAHVICIKIPAENMCLASIYRTYKLTHKNSHLAAIEEQISVLNHFMLLGMDIIIMGDVNLDYKKKNDYSYHLRRIYDEWTKFEQDHQLVQTVDFVTWRRKNGSHIIESILDHVYTNNCSLIESVEEADYLLGDHSPVVVTLMKTHKNKASMMTIRDWKKYSPQLLLESLAECNWEISLEGVQDYTDELEHRIMTIVDKLAPFVEKKFVGSQFSESSKVSGLKRKRKNMLINARRRNSADLLRRSQKLGKEIKRIKEMSRQEKIRQKILSGGQAGLWKGLHLALDKAVEQIPNEIRWDNKTIMKSSEKAQAFADFFCAKTKSLVEENSVQDDVENGEKVVDAEETNYVTLGRTVEIMKNLQQKNCYGCDRIPLRILRDGYSVLGKPVYALMNKIYEQKKIPEQWKMSRIIPLHKRGSKAKIENYRPISNLCAMSKVFEKLMLQRILETADGNTLFTKHQHGFRKKRSTITAIAELQNAIATHMDLDEYVAVASLDLSAAFDVVNVDLLLKRLEKMGIPNDLTKILTSWLKDRAAYVEVDGESSEYFLVTEGTVQGSVLGPVLFNLFIRPLLEKTNSPAYADDSYHCGTSRTKKQALEILERKLGEAIGWITKSGLKVNVGKTELCIFHRMDTSKGTLTVGNVRVESSHQLSCLGILMDNRLSWDKQVDKAITESRKALQAVRVVRRFFNREETKKLVTSLVYSRLYYASEVWLLPTLKEELFKKLYSQSGKILKVVDKELSYTQLHKTLSRATPRIYSLYQTCVNYYNVMCDQGLLPGVKESSILNTMQASRNDALVFIRQNVYKCGLNIVSHRLRSVTCMIKKEWMLMDKAVFKAHCKKYVIQQQLLLL